MREFKCAVIDDDADWTDLVRRALHRPGLPLAITCFTDAEIALGYLRHQSVDVVICDFRMPKLDGFAFTAEFRNFSPHTAVIISSSEYLSKDEVHARGANGYVPKRDLNSELPDVVATLLGVIRRDSILLGHGQGET